MASLAFPSAAFAQPAEPSASEQAQPTEQAQGGNDQTQEIVVTAEFRATNVQDTPIAITAVNAAMLEARGQTNITDVAAQAPNVTLKPQGQENGSGIVAFIRGVGQTDFNFALEPGVGIYVDDVYYPTLTGAQLDLMDLDRIEILRGPQGTLAGKNSIGGAIKLFSRKPTGQTRGSFQATYGSFNRVEARGFVDFPIVKDHLFARISAVGRSQDGYVTRYDYKLTHPTEPVPTFAQGNKQKIGTMGGISYTAVRASLRWLPTSNIEVNVSGDYTQDKSEVGPSVLLYANARGTNADGMPWVPRTDNPALPVPFDCRFISVGPNACDTLSGHNRKYRSYATFIDATPPTSQSPYKPYFTDPIQHLKQWGVQGTIDWNLSDQFQLKSISAYRGYTSQWAQDADNSPLASQQLLQTLKQHQYSEELRLNGKILNDMVDFTLGGFYFKMGGTLNARVDLNYAGIDFIHGPDTTPTWSQALFAHTTIHATDALDISGGLRHSWDKKIYTYFRSNPDGTIPGPLPCAFFLGAPTAGPTGIGNDPNCLLLGLYGLTDSFKGQRWDWRAAINYRWSPELMTYVQVSTGYKGGGVNPRPFFGPSAGPLNQLKSFDPETQLTYEAGFKADLFDRHVRFNAAAFYNKYSDIILTLSACPISPCLQPNNVGKADVKGVEFETTIRPVPGVTLDGALSYLDFKYKKITDPSSFVTKGMITPYTPNWKWSFGAQYDIADVLDGGLSFRIDGDYQSHVYTEAINLDPTPITNPATGNTQIASNRINGYFLANGRITWKSDENDWQVALEVQNIFNKYYYTHLFDQHANSSSSTISASPGLPRTWAITVKKTF
ncbi:MAG: TonB-dependent receptor [Sphingomonadales bacterium]